MEHIDCHKYLKKTVQICQYRPYVPNNVVNTCGRLPLTVSRKLMIIEPKATVKLQELFNLK